MRFRSLIYFTVILFPFLLYGLTNQQAQVDDMQVFYKKPSFERFMKITEDLAKFHEDRKINSGAVIFTMLALEKHPDFPAKVVPTFEKLAQNQKILLYTGLVGAGQDKEAASIVKQYHYTHPLTVNLKATQISELELLKSLKTTEELEQQIRIIDYLWAAFFATGDEKYLQKMLDYLLSNKTFLSLEWDEKLTFSQLLDKTAIGTLLWSINSNTCQDAALKKTVIALAQKKGLSSLAQSITKQNCSS